MARSKVESHRVFLPYVGDQSTRRTLPQVRFTRLSRRTANARTSGHLIPSRKQLRPSKRPCRTTSMAAISTVVVISVPLCNPWSAYGHVRINHTPGLDPSRPRIYCRSLRTSTSALPLLTRPPAVAINQHATVVIQSGHLIRDGSGRAGSSRVRECPPDARAVMVNSVIMDERASGRMR
jgi:hypothetical protein